MSICVEEGIPEKMEKDQNRGSSHDSGGSPDWLGCDQPGRSEGKARVALA